MPVHLPVRGPIQWQASQVRSRKQNRQNEPSEDGEGEPRKDKGHMVMPWSGACPHRLATFATWSACVTLSTALIVCIQQRWHATYDECRTKCAAPYSMAVVRLPAG